MLLVKVKYTRYNSSGDPHYCALMQEGKHHYLKKSRVDKFWQQTSELVRKFPRAIPELRICLCLLQIACMTNFHLRYTRNYHICEREVYPDISEVKAVQWDWHRNLSARGGQCICWPTSCGLPSFFFLCWLVTTSFNWNKKFLKSHTTLRNFRKRLIMPIFRCVSNFINNFLRGGHSNRLHKYTQMIRSPFTWAEVWTDCWGEP